MLYSHLIDLGRFLWGITPLFDENWFLEIENRQVIFQKINRREFDDK
jgi:hypothetical protein